MSREKQPRAASPFAPVGKKDKLVSVRVYARTEDRHDKRAIVVCVFKRHNRDLERVAAGSTDTQYCKIGSAPFSYHTDADGSLFWHIDTWGGGPHFRALMKLGIEHISVNRLSTDNGSESSKRLGLRVQNMTVSAGGLQLPYTRVSPIGEWWTTHGLDSFGPDPVHFTCRSEYRWGDMPVVWCGITLGDIQVDQAAAREQLKERAHRAAVQ